MNVEAGSIYQDGTYLEHNNSWHSEDSPTKARWIAEILARNNIRPDTLAEIGCGAGEILSELQARLPQTAFSGFEVSPQAFSICGPKQREGLTFFLEDLTTTSREPFDVLLAIDVFEHVPDYIGFISSLKRLAEYKVFHIPLDLSAQGLMRPKSLPYVRDKIGHLHYFNKETALATLEYAGLEVVDWNFTKGTQELPNRRLKTRLANLPRKALQTIDIGLSARMLGGYSLLVLTR